MNSRRFNPQNIYQQLYHHYGPQGWWPLLQRSGRPGYTAEGYHPGIYDLRLGAAERFEIVTGAILTQNTSWTNVRSSLVKLLEAADRRNKEFGPEFVLGITRDELAGLIRSSGYFNQKAKKLRYAAELVLAHSAPSRSDPKRSELLSVWGIGPETADSILLYAYNRPVCVVDAYSVRVFKRLAGENGHRGWGYDELQAVFHAGLPTDRRVYNEFHALVVEHAKRHCTAKNPLCDKCPLKSMCGFLAQKR